MTPIQTSTTFRPTVRRQRALNGDQQKYRKWDGSGFPLDYKSRHLYIPRMLYRRNQYHPFTSALSHPISIQRIIRPHPVIVGKMQYVSTDLIAHACIALNLSRNSPDPDEVVGVTTKQGLAICGPGERCAFGFSGGFGDVVKVGSEVVDDGSRDQHKSD